MSVYIVADNIAYTGPAVEHEQTKYIIYKLVVPYMAIEHITYEYASGGQDSPTHNLYVRLKHPPQVGSRRRLMFQCKQLWRAVPRPADMLRQQRFAQLSYKRCNDWERVTSIVSSDNRAPLDQTALASIDTICIRMLFARAFTVSLSAQGTMSSSIHRACRVRAIDTRTAFTMCTVTR
jgi:hypothetical protein